MVGLAKRQKLCTPLRVLVVEDSEDDALLLLRELERGGYEPVHERVDTPEAMEKALNDPSWDVIFSDYSMPRFDAPKALRIWREAGSEAPFIVVSGKVGEDVAVEMVKAGAHDYVMKDNLTRLCATVERGLEEARERRERRRVQKELERREAILEAVGFAAERFLREAAGWEESIEEVLERLGEATGASRVYVFENYLGEDGEVWATQRYEWVVPGVPAQMDNPLMDAFPYKAAGYGRWARLMGRGEPVYGHTREFSENERSELEAQGILSIAIVPVFVEGEWWGTIGFDECLDEHEWSATEVDALKAAAGTLGAAIQRRRTEEELRGSEERYRAVIEQATDGIYLLDAGTRCVLETNPAFQKMLGYTAEELRGMEVYDFVAHSRENADAVIRRTLKERRRIVGERKYRRKDGSLLDVEVGVSVIFHGGREVICTIVRDVTERKRAEEELRQSEELYRAVVEQAAENIFLVDVDTKRILRPNAAFQQLLGYTAEELQRTTLYDVVAHDRESIDRNTQRILAEGRYSVGERRYRRKDGSLVDAEINVSTISYGGRRALCVVSRDITERKRAEEKLRASEAELRAVFGAMNDVILVFDGEGRYLKVAPTDPSLLYRPPDELLGKTLHDLFPKERADWFLASIRRALETRKRVNIEYSLPIGERQRWFSTTVSPMLEDSVVAVRHDITERKRAEDALKESERLYRTVIEQATENICLVDAQTRRVAESNPAFQRALGYTEEELKDMTLYDFVAHDRESIDENLRRTLKERRRSVGQRKYRRKDGSLLDVEVSASTILRDSRETFCVVAHDVSERARTQRLLEERVATLARIASSLTLDAPVEETLRALAESVIGASTATTYLVVLADGGTDEEIRVVGSHGLPAGYYEGLRAVFEAGIWSPVHEAILTRRPTVFRDSHQIILNEPLYSPLHPFADEVLVDTIYILPLVLRGRAVGAICFGYLPGREPTEDEKSFLSAVADQTAVAVENARLFAQARGKAALEERQRLARELHDSVSQALYGIALGAKTARTLLERNPKGAADPIDYVLSLAEAGMAEMRALIFELRPESLEKEGLAAALEKQAAAVRARHEIEVEATLCDEPKASPEAKETVYRIAQEALHNTVKHARASNVEIGMRCDPKRITLEVSDDGIGFDAGGEFPGHLGLHSMRERASRLGGTLEVASAPGRGTRIHARIPV